ncbi:Para-hydroxybenzoate--polyprenyltransferase, mitochondrial precursor (PHB:polyprenyltransferase) [Kalmusia sp. IMI 367209]|nr:Para-hydroxybenzoate--polyprenyltransferase, mitochondrial precursor (PHB:polyprenyltransferase) [Kalmusia sp. IMI 367209]
MAAPIAAPSAVAGTTALFFTGALVMRGAGCTINDLWDRNLDPHVERTRLRPIARKAISPQAAIVFTGCQLLTGLAVLLSFPFECFWYATPSLLFVATYPLAKRVTNYPQFVLGLTFSWGAMMGFPALGVDLLSNQAALTAAACLYGSNVAWTVLYDMIYAHMDIKDDAKAGIKSIALKHDKETKAVLTGLAAIQISLLAATGVAAGMGPVFFAGACGSAAVTLGTMIWRVQLKDVKNCWWWFKNGAWFTGGGIALGLTGEYLAQYLGWYDEGEGSEDRYLSQADAQSQGLYTVSGNNVILSVDSKNKAPTGRASVRLESKKLYNRGLFIMDVAHMPASTCGSWPSFWSWGSEKTWPTNGEIGE